MSKESTEQSAEQSTKPSKKGMTAVTLKCKHTHNRQECGRGDTIEVSKATADNLRKQGVAE